MTDQNSFTETLRAVAEIVRIAEAPLSETEMLSYFSGMELSKEQEKMVLEYLKNLPPDETEAGGEGDKAIEGRTSILNMYLEELETLPNHSDEERQHLYDKLLSGDDRVISDIVEIWLPRVTDIARKYEQEKIPVEDLIQEGNMALFVSLNELCGACEMGDVKEHLEKAIELGVMEYASGLMGELEHENVMKGKINLVYEAIKYLKEEKGEAPTPKELSDYTRLDIDELKEVVDIIDKMTGE